MDAESFHQAALLFSGDYSLDILRALRDGEWHLSSEVARALGIHVSTVSRFLQRVADLGLLDRRPHDARTFEFRMRSPRFLLETDLTDDAAPLRESVDFYVSYFQSLFEGIRHLGHPEVQGTMEKALVTEHRELRAAVFEQMIAGSQGGLDHLRELMAALHQDLWAVCSQSLGQSAAKELFRAALRDAIASHPDLAVRCGLARPLEA